MLKTHGRLSDKQKLILKDLDAWVFHTTNLHHTRNPDVRKFDQDLGFPVVMSVDTSEVGAEGYEVARDKYQQLLGLTLTQIDLMYDWLSKWDVLRVCCGEQMSKYWRAELQGMPLLEDKKGKFQGENPVEVCSSLDISDIERALMETILYQKMRKEVPMLARVSNNDLEFTGHYCQQCNRNIRAFNLSFNNGCSKPLAVYCRGQKDNPHCKK